MSPSSVRACGCRRRPGRDLLRDGRLPEGWPRDRPPNHLKTRLPSVVAVGDVRQRALAHVASAVGAGATAIAVILEYLQERTRRWWSTT